VKIAVTANEASLDSVVDPRFGRCACFLVIETDSLEFEAVENSNAMLGGGAGIQSAQLMAEKGVVAVLTGNCGPNAHQTLSAAGINIIVGCSGRIRDIVEQFKAGQLNSADAANVPSHFGMGGSTANPGEATSGPQNPMPGGGIGMGQGMGKGMGRGMGGGRGMGQGMGRGMGGGRGMGQGMGAGMNVGSQPMQGPIMPQAPAGPGAATSKDQEVELLKAQAQQLEKQLQAINVQLGQAQQARSTGGLVAVVNGEKCNACDLCQQVCSFDAITVDDIARIDRAKCTGCGQCVTECPQEALSLHKA